MEISNVLFPNCQTKYCSCGGQRPPVHSAPDQLIGSVLQVVGTNGVGFPLRCGLGNIRPARCYPEFPFLMPSRSTSDPTPRAPQLTPELTHGHILRIAIPVMLSNVSTPLIGIVDTGVVGQIPDPSLIGAVAPFLVV